ncbi:MAG: ABC transporter ATP-binding protein [Clostridia bacterium]|nr:ABC transporter ATP-binding protein [Clostridia bacterium]MBQ7316558.1 ABC transporter ATP-binding protein [Clostridia bacterium]
MAEKKNSHYLSGKEIRAIAKANRKEMNRLEKKKYRRAAESEFVTEMKDPANILEIEDLHTYFFTDQGVVKAVNGVSFNIPRNKVVGIVGESGCGKSVTSMSVMRLLQGPQGQIVSGSIRFNSYDFKRDSHGNTIPTGENDESGNPIYEMEDKVYDIAEMPMREIHCIRGRQISMIFQEPMTSLNPVFTIGNQLDEVTFIHTPGATKETAKNRSMEMLKLVGIAAPERVYNSFPHELSGGMRQRVMISMALACNPRLIIADEPTTALDVTIQAQILDLLRDLKDKINGSIMLITHDLGVIAEMADYVVVMYAGRVIEKGTVQEIFHDPRHPYTIGLQKSKPTMDSDSDTLFNIPGNVPNPVNMPNHCYFKERCDRCIGKCSGDYPGMIQVSPTHFVSCHLYGEEEYHG